MRERSNDSSSPRRARPTFQREIRTLGAPSERLPTTPMAPCRLHVNVDHVATVRQARRAARPDPVAWALAAARAGAQGITLHLRKDRRHIQDDDVPRLRRLYDGLLNLEMSLDPEIVALALESRADEVCIVPENRQEVTTEGGLDVHTERARLAQVIPRLRAKGIQVSLFVDALPEMLEVSAALGADFVELHTGSYANAAGSPRERELERLRQGAEQSHGLGLRVNAGHGLDYDNVIPVARLPHVEELNIGHAIVARALFVGVEAAVREMRLLIERARAAEPCATQGTRGPHGPRGSLALPQMDESTGRGELPGEPSGVAEVLTRPSAPAPNSPQRAAPRKGARP
jgi:pyridoxine 5-phosphate synthase